MNVNYAPSTPRVAPRPGAMVRRLSMLSRNQPYYMVSRENRTGLKLQCTNFHNLLVDNFDALLRNAQDPQTKFIVEKGYKMPLTLTNQAVLNDCYQALYLTMLKHAKLVYSYSSDPVLVENLRYGRPIHSLKLKLAHSGLPLHCVDNLIQYLFYYPEPCNSLSTHMAVLVRPEDTDLSDIYGHSSDDESGSGDDEDYVPECNPHEDCTHCLSNPAHYHLKTRNPGMGYPVLYHTFYSGVCKECFETLYEVHSHASCPNASGFFDYLCVKKRVVVPQ